jgi:hypothetical protein
MTTAKSNGHLGWNDQVVSHRRRSDVVVVVIVTGPQPFVTVANSLLTSSDIMASSV